jgi:hypothetical protein
MDGSRRAHLDTRADVSTPIPHRCGWCGLLPLADDQTLDDEHELCGSCLAILKDVDWRALLAKNALVQG